jgi:hypothetical protein
MTYSLAREVKPMWEKALIIVSAILNQKIRQGDGERGPTMLPDGAWKKEEKKGAILLERMAANYKRKSAKIGR